MKMSLPLLVTAVCIFQGLLSLDAKSQGLEKRVALTGAEFIRDCTNPLLGEAYRDSRGLIWGDTLKTRGVDRYKGEQYCIDIGARLPTGREFTKLADDLGAEHLGYTPYMLDRKTQVLPHLDRNLFWIDSPTGWASLARYFAGNKGFISETVSDPEVGNVGMTVRCVQDSKGSPVKECSVNDLPKTSSASNERVSNTGAVFTRDMAFPALGEAYKDPSGLTWGEVVSENGPVKQMTQSRANAYCESVGARLPTRPEFEDLRTFLGSASAQGYNPFLGDTADEILPGFLIHDNFWSASSEDYPNSYYLLNPYTGLIYSERLNHLTAVKCVAGRPAKWF